MCYLFRFGCECEVARNAIAIICWLNVFVQFRLKFEEKNLIGSALGFSQAYIRLFKFKEIDHYVKEFVVLKLNLFTFHVPFFTKL